MECISSAFSPGQRIASIFKSEHQKTFGEGPHATPASYRRGSGHSKFSQFLGDSLVHNKTFAITSSYDGNQWRYTVYLKQNRKYTGLLVEQCVYTLKRQPSEWDPHSINGIADNRRWWVGTQ